MIWWPCKLASWSPQPVNLRYPAKPTHRCGSMSHVPASSRHAYGADDDQSTRTPFDLDVIAAIPSLITSESQLGITRMFAVGGSSCGSVVITALICMKPRELCAHGSGVVLDLHGWRQLYAYLPGGRVSLHEGPAPALRLRWYVQPPNPRTCPHRAHGAPRKANGGGRTGIARTCPIQARR